MPFGGGMRIPEDRQQFVPRADLNILVFILVNIIKVAFLVAVIARFGPLEDREFNIHVMDGDQQPWSPLVQR